MYSKINLRSNIIRYELEMKMFRIQHSGPDMNIMSSWLRPLVDECSNCIYDLMNIIFQFYLDQFFIVFIDDILIYSISKTEHVGHLRLKLHVLRDRRLYVKLNKCDFWLDRVVLLGHVISRDGIYVDTKKVEVVLQWSAPISVPDILSFLGITGYYHRFIEDFSKLARPLTQLTQKGMRFQWSEACERSFQELKHRLTTALVLSIPTENERFVVYTNASLHDLKCVWMQDRHVVAYALRQLKPLEAMYHVHDLELKSIIYTIHLLRFKLILKV